MAIALQDGWGRSEVLLRLSSTPTQRNANTDSVHYLCTPEASTGSGPASVLATGGPNFASGVPATTVFPVLQTALVYDNHSVKPDTNANSTGGTGTVQSGTLKVAIEPYDAALPDFRFQSAGYANLDWMRVGYWVTGGNKWDYDDSVGRYGVFVSGTKSPGTCLRPARGVHGSVEGRVLLSCTGPISTHCAAA